MDFLNVDLQLFCNVNYFRKLSKYELALPNNRIIIVEFSLYSCICLCSTFLAVVWYYYLSMFCFNSNYPLS